MGDPLLEPSDLALAMNDSNINEDRATALIADAQALCESILSPLPASAAVIVKRVAIRAYATTTSARAVQLAAAGSPFVPSTPGPGGAYLTRTDRADLRRLSGSGGAFEIDLLPRDRSDVRLPPWDVQGVVGVETS